MMLQTGNPNVRFQARPIEGVTLSNSREPERLILDGQQRLTSLVQTLLSGKPVIIKDVRQDKYIYRWYYIDIVKALALNVEREEAIISLPEDKIIRNLQGEVLADYSTLDKEYEKEVFPVSQLFDYSDWMTSHNEFWDYDREKVKLFNKFNQEIIKPFEQYQVPVILLRKETPREAVCQVFEKVNTGGITLTVFELLTATFAADEFKLQEDWDERKKQLKDLQVLSNIKNTEFLQAVTLIVTRARRQQAILSGTLPSHAPAISCTRKDILNLTLDEYKTWADKVTQGFKKAAKFLHTLKIFTARDLPYQPQVTALAAIFVALGEHGDSAGVKTKLERWYWCGVFGEIYSKASNSKLAQDLSDFQTWLDEDSEPNTIVNANFAPARLLSLRTRNTAAYKGLSALLMRDGSHDFHTNFDIDTQVFFDERIDIHHIFPQAWCKKQNIDQKRWDSIINKTPLSARTNKIIGGKSPSVYLQDIQNQAGISQADLDEILRSHVIEPVTLRADDFDSFFKTRKQALIERIEKAIGKSLLPDVIEIVEVEDADLTEYDENVDNLSSFFR